MVVTVVVTVVVVVVVVVVVIVAALAGISCEHPRHVQTQARQACTPFQLTPPRSRASMRGTCRR